MNSHMTPDLWLAQENGDISLIENNGECIQGLPLPDHAGLIAQHAMALERVIRLAVKLERLDVGISLDLYPEDDGIDAFLIRSPDGYFGTVENVEFHNSPTAADTARLAYGLPTSPDLMARVRDTLRVESAKEPNS